LQVRVVHTIAGLKDRAGGVARSVPGLCEALAREGCAALLVSQKPAGVAREALLTPDPALVETRLLAGSDWERWRISYTPRLGAQLRSILAEFKPGVLHDHGLWLHMNHAAAIAARNPRVPRVVSPRGMLEQWSLSYRAWKKRLAWRAYQQGDLQAADAFCTTSHAEADSVRALGFRQPIAVIPNGVPMPRPIAKSMGTERKVVFMSRLHPKKGLLDLVQAWKSIDARGWKLVLAGPDEDGHGQVVREAVRAAGLEGHVLFAGSVSGDAKRDLLGSADLFVLPSYSENFGIVVGEALSYGVPVITTTGTPWSNLVEQRCGWWVPPGADSIAAALTAAMAQSDAERAAMGARGRELVEARFSWPAVARQHIALYRWLGGEGAPPQAVLH
jgi:glycosyltransferase involved in cell wall biosynthesis